MAGVLQKFPSLVARFARSSQLIGAQIPHRNSSFRSSKPVADISEYPEVEVCRNPPEWKFVERLLPPLTIPKPDPKTNCPSGWQAAKPIGDKKYFIARTKNHMLPVYLKTSHRGLRRLTAIRYIQGDIWALEKELHRVVEEHKGRVVASRVNELSGQIQFHGDYVNLIKDWLLSKGF